MLSYGMASCGVLYFLQKGLFYILLFIFFFIILQIYAQTSEINKVYFIISQRVQSIFAVYRKYTHKQSR